MKSAVAAEGSRDQAAVIAVCCAAIAGLSALAVQHRSETPCRSNASNSCARCATCINTAHMSQAGPYWILAAGTHGMHQSPRFSPILLTESCNMTADADSNKVAQSAAELGNMVLGQSDGAPALQRSAAEILAAAAAIGDAAFAQALLRRVVEAMAGTANPVRC